MTATKTVHSPFKEEQVKSLNAFQGDDRNHPFTCGKCKREKDGDGVLVATKESWHCLGCDYTQSWALSFMADWAWKRGGF